MERERPSRPFKQARPWRLELGEKSGLRSIYRSVYLITACSSSCSAQADDIPAIQLCDLLLMQEVRPNDIQLLIPVIEGQTAETRRRSIFGRPPTVPTEFGKGFTGEQGCAQTDSMFMRNFLTRTDVVAIIGVLLNNSDEDSKVSPQAVLGVRKFTGIFANLPDDTTPKNVLIIPDSCPSDMFSQNSMEERFTFIPIRFLTSAAGRCSTSLIEVSENTELVNCFRDPNDGKEIHYSVNSPMFVRGPLRMIAYSDKNQKNA
jgi:hypothetical protein